MMFAEVFLHAAVCSVSGAKMFVLLVCSRWKEFKVAVAELFFNKKTSIWEIRTSDYSGDYFLW